MDTTIKTLPEYEQNPQLHLKKLYEFKVSTKKYYYGEDQEVLLDGIDRKIKEVRKNIAALELKGDK